MFERTATDLDTQPTTTQQRLTLALKNARLLPDGCCCLNSTGSKILFSINWRRVNLGLNVAPYEEVSWGEVRWPWRPSHRSAPSNAAIVVCGGEMLILKRILLPVSLRQQQPGILNSHVSLCCVVVAYVSRSVAVRSNICCKLVRNTFFFSEYLSVFAWFET